MTSTSGRRSRHIFVFTVLYSAIIFISCVIPKLTSLISVFGSTTLPAMTYVLPGYLFWQFYKDNEDKKWRNQANLGLALMIIGIIIIISFMTISLIEFGSAEDGDFS